MKDIVKIFDDIKNNSSRSAKESILLNNKDNDLFRYILSFVYNPYIVTGISSKKIKKKVDLDIDREHVFGSIDGLIRYLKDHNSGRDYDISVVKLFINSLETKEEKELVKKIVTKSLKVGITSKTINKAYDDLEIPSFAVMLANPFDKKEKTVKGDFYITQKLDGNRLIAIKSNDSVKFFTRSGQEIDGMGELSKEFINFKNDTVFDGEVLLKNDKNLPSDELFRETQKVIRKDGEKKDLEFYVFDHLSLSEFKQGQSVDNYDFRREVLEELFNFHYSSLNNVKLLPVLYKGDDKSIITSLMKYAEENHWEGLMLNTSDGLYENKRTNSLLKIKKMKSADLIVMSMEEGSGKYEGKLGRINVEYKDGLTGVGSGFTDDERVYYWSNPDEIIGKIVEINFFEESVDSKSNQASMRFPIFKTVREDKSVEDIRYE